VTAERSELPGRIDEVVQRAMAKDPADRHPTAGAVIAEATHALAPGAAPLHEPKPPPPERVRNVRAVVAAVVALALVAVALPRFLFDGEPEAPTFRPGVTLFDPETLEPVAQLPVEEPVEGHFTDGSFWFLNLEPLSFVQIDAQRRRIVNRINSPIDDVSSFAVAGNSLWVGHASQPILVRVDTTTGREADRYRYAEGGGEDGLVGPVFGDESVWVRRGAEVLRIIPGSGEVQARIPVEIGQDNQMSFSEGAIWVSGDAHLLRIDPATNEVATTVPIYTGMKFPLGGGGFGWVTDPDGNEVYQFHPNGGQIGAYVTGEGPESIAYGDGKIWVANHDSGTIGTIDVETREEGSVDLGHPVQGIAFGNGLVAVTVGRGKSLTDRIAAIGGSALRLVATEPYNSTADPALASDVGMWQVERATCAKLLNYPDAPAPDGWILRPEIAAAMPNVSPDGRTYTFRIRDGFRFPPPSNTPVTAETFRFAIERALSPELGARALGVTQLGDIVGLEAFRERRAEHIRGLSAAGDTLAITLTEPSADFLHRLALPYFCPVPTDTPILEGGVGSRPVPSAGPYFVSDNEDAEVLILERNPNYVGERRAVFDAIVVRFGLDPQVAVEEAQAGRWDGVMGFAGEIYFGAISGWEGFATTPLANTSFLALNASGSAFADPDVRRAAALATDRFAFTQFGGASFVGTVPSPGIVYVSLAAVGGIPTDGLLPPDFPGAEPEISATLLDLERAKLTLGDRRPSATLAVPPGPGGRCEGAERFCPYGAVRVARGLREAGFRVRFVSAAPSDLLRNPDGFDLVFGQTFTPYPDTGTFVTETVLGGGVPASWFPEDMRREAMRIEDLTGEERIAAASTLADLLVEEHLLVPLGISPRSSFLSDRIGCVIYPPFGWGFDLVTLCPSG
jgi:hypothetical protein